jgi:hypothetical protein
MNCKPAATVRWRTFSLLLELQFPPPMPVIQHNHYKLFAMDTKFILLYCPLLFCCYRSNAGRFTVHQNRHYSKENCFVLLRNLKVEIYANFFADRSCICK